MAIGNPLVLFLTICPLLYAPSWLPSWLGSCGASVVLLLFYSRGVQNSHHLQNTSRSLLCEVEWLEGISAHVDGQVPTDEDAVGDL